MPYRRNKGRKIGQFVDDFTVIDLETTGLNINTAEIIEIGAIRVRANKETDTFDTLVRPSSPIPADVTAINHIDDAMVADAPVIGDVIDDFLEFIGSDVLVGHNIGSFDLNILYDQVMALRAAELRNDYLDTLDLAHICFPKMKNRSLEALCLHFGFDTEGEHRALQDCRLTLQCEEAMRQLCREKKLDPFGRKSGKITVDFDTDRVYSGAAPARSKKDPQAEIEKNARRSLGLPISKSLVYYPDTRVNETRAVETYEVIEIYPEWFTLLLHLKGGGEVKIHSMHLKEMQSPTFVTDMNKTND